MDSFIIWTFVKLNKNIWLLKEYDFGCFKQTQPRYIIASIASLCWEIETDQFLFKTTFP